MKTKKVIVIGAGVGGITAAIHLAKNGLQVTVIEKNARPGGRCDRISREGHHFDTGPTLLVMPLLYESEFAALGVSMHETLDLQRVDPTYHLVFDDGSRLALTSDMEFLQKQMEAIEPGSFQNFLRYVDEGKRHYHLSMENLVYPDFRKATDFFKLSNIPLLHQVKPLIKHYANMSNYFDDPRLKAAFTFQDVYMGLSPFEAPATFSMMPYTELAHGVWYPKGGMYQVVEALVSLARQEGVEFFFNKAVERIDVNGNHTRGVVVDGQRQEAEAVLANADLPYVYQNLLPKDGLSEKLARKRYSCSVISFLWGVDRPYETLGPHTLFLADDYRENFESIIRDLGLPANPSLYVHAPARLDPSMAPPGQDTLVAIVPVGHMSENGDQDWAAIRDQARQHVFRRLRLLGIHDLEQHIKFEMNLTPLSSRKRYNLVKGSTHGLCHNLTQLGYFRPDFQHPRYANLYFTVTVDEFRRFVKATGYVTVAERPLDPADYPDADPALLVPGALVFQKSRGPVDLGDYRNWWAYVPGASWKHPEGPGSNLNGRNKHPVTQVAYEDAEAYARWAGKELPTEAEWEVAARGGLKGAVFAWGNEFAPKGRMMANTWQGQFPWQNLNLDGYEGTSPVGSFPPNGYGLYDMGGNVWQWTCDFFTTRLPDDVTHPCCAPHNPRVTAPEQGTFAVGQPGANIPRRVLKGGSHLCAPSYCLRYRPAARQAEMVDTSTGHIGFRCVVRPQ